MAGVRSAAPSLAQLLLLDPFHGGSHSAFSRHLVDGIQAQWRIDTLPARHWKWRLRGAAVHFAQRMASLSAPDLLVTTSMLSLSDLKGLVPQLGHVPSFLYFHENQLAYPTRHDNVRDHHFGFTQLISARAATCCGFNSRYNLESFLNAADGLLGALPDAVPSGWLEDIRRKSRILPIPLSLPTVVTAGGDPGHPAGPIILWNHRWEHDKRPEAFFSALEQVDARGRPFRLAVAGPRFGRWPACFDEARARWGDRIVQFGPVQPRSTYEALLSTVDIAVSTAAHEFFGVAMLEAAHFGAQILVPDRLAYPEIFPTDFRYRDDADLVARLVASIDRWSAGEPLRGDRRNLTAKFGRPARQAFADTFAELTNKVVPLSDMVSDESL